MRRIGFIRARSKVVAGSGGGEPTYAFYDAFESGVKSPLISNSNDSLELLTPRPAWATGAGVVTVDASRSPWSYGMRFNCGTTASNPEQRFVFSEQIGGEGQTVWFEWWNRVGSNFYANGNTTSKWFQFWHTTYTTSATVGGSLLSLGNGAFQVQQAISTSGVGQASYVPGEYWTGVNFTPAPTFPNGSRLVAPLGSGLSSAMTPGQWHRVRIEVTWASSFLAIDGRYRIWIDDQLYMDSNPVNIHNNQWERQNGDSPFGLNGGYLLGYTNAGYQTETTWDFSEVKIMSTNPNWGY